LEETSLCVTDTVLKIISEYTKGKAIPLQAWTGVEGSGRMRHPDFKTVGI